MDDNHRELDIAIAKALGFIVAHGALYAPLPNRTLIGGNVEVHMKSLPMKPEIEEAIWQVYTPRFSSRMDEAMHVLKIINEMYGISYGLFLENDDEHHTAEIGHWSNEAGQSDKVWSATEKDPALAIAKAIAQCPIVMGSTETKAV